MIDTHIHLFRTKLPYPWLPAPVREVTLDDYPWAATGAKEVLLVEAGALNGDKEEEEHRHLSGDRRVIGFVQAVELHALFERPAPQPWVVGYRLRTTGVSHVAFSRRLEGLTRPIDLLLRPDLPPAAALCLIENNPSITFVVDHLASPQLFVEDSWKRLLDALCLAPNVFIKLSGQPARQPSMVAHVLDRFGPQRCMFGSDWPVTTLDPPEMSWVDSLTPQDRRWVLRGVASFVYPRNSHDRA